MFVKMEKRDNKEKCIHDSSDIEMAQFHIGRY